MELSERRDRGSIHKVRVVRFDLGCAYMYGKFTLSFSSSSCSILGLSYLVPFFQVPALIRFLQNRRSHMQQHPDFHITSSTILSTLHITRLNTRNHGPLNMENASGHGISVLRPGGDVPIPPNVQGEVPGLQDQLGNANQQNETTGRDSLPIPDHDLQQQEAGQNPGNMNSFSSLLLWILGGASSESLNNFFSIFRDMRDQAQFYADSARQEDHIANNPQ